MLCVSSFAVEAAPKSEPWSYWTPHDTTSEFKPDHQAWQVFLDQYVAKYPDGINRVAYRRINEEQGNVLLDDYLSDMASLDPRQLNRSEQMAYWINLYNAHTVKLVLGYPDKKGILKMGLKIFAIGPWDDVIATIAGEEISLNDIEHRILRPIWGDHRIHYAVNCASLGCPNLNKIAFNGVNLERLLTEGEDDYLNHSRGLKRLKNDKLQLSEIFKWYESDFGASKQEVVAYIGRHSRAMSGYDHNSRLRISYEYNWELNSQVER
jgi:hypothetical protein